MQESTLYELPDDVDGYFDVTSTNFSVPFGTSYACTSKVIPLPDSGDRMIVAIEPLFKNYSASLVHHFNAYICSGDQYAAVTASTVRCDGFLTGGLFGPTANSFAMCSTNIYGCKLSHIFFKIFLPFYFAYSAHDVV